MKSDDAARVNASRLLTNANIKKYIDDRMEEIHNEKTADAQEVIEYLTSVMRGESTSEEIVVGRNRRRMQHSEGDRESTIRERQAKAADFLKAVWTVY